MVLEEEPPSVQRSIGWHATEDNPDELYYWDGAHWTQHLVHGRWATNPIPVAQQAANPEPADRSHASQRPLHASLLFSILIICGSLGTWLTVSGVSKSGTSLSIGYVSIVAGVAIFAASLALLIWRGVLSQSLLPVMVAAAGASMAIPLWRLYEAIARSTIGNLGWGLYVVIFAGLGAFFAGAILTARR